MRFPGKNKPKEPKRTIADEVSQIISDVIFDLRRKPVEVRHTVERKIPRPTMVSFWIQDMEGRTFHLPPIDLSYKRTMPLQIPLYYLTGDPKDNGRTATIEMDLHYEPKDGG